MQKSIVEYLKENFQPDSIILHGSRARGKERPHSDWDFILLYRQPTLVKNSRLFVDGQNVEYSVTVLPIIDIFGTFDTKLNKAKVIFDTDDIGTKLIADATAYYNIGVHWDEEKRNAHKLWLEGRLAGMRDNIDNPLLFQKYFGDFYGRIFNYWYWLVAHQHSEPIYDAVDEIKERDIEYFNLINKLIRIDTNNTNKVHLAETIVSKLFREEVR